MITEDYKKLIEDKEIQKIQKAWIAYNGGQGMPIYNDSLYVTIDEYKKILATKYKKLGID